MPVFKVDVQTNLGNGFVTNVYHVEADDMSAATQQGLSIVNMQRVLLPTGLAIDAMRVSTPTPGDNFFNTVPLNLAGLRTVSSDPMPMFTRFRVDFAIGFRRPLRKFFLVPLEGDQIAGTFTQAARTFVAEQYVLPLLTNQTIKLVAVDGSPVLSAVLNPSVGMRQLRRASKRVNPVI